MENVRPEHYCILILSQLIKLKEMTEHPMGEFTYLMNNRIENYLEKVKEWNKEVIDTRDIEVIKAYKTFLTSDLETDTPEAAIPHIEDAIGSIKRSAIVRREI